MRKKLVLILLPTTILFSTLIAECLCRNSVHANVAWDHPATMALLAPIWTTVLVLSAMFKRDPRDTDSALKQHLDLLNGVALSISYEPWKTFYDKTTQLHIDTDKGMYQLITVFVGASVLVLGWVAGSSQFASITPDHIVIVGSLAVVLVGIATLLKHRLRYYNKLREIYLRKLEEKLCDGRASEGPHGFTKVAVRTPWFEASFHEVIDIYYFIYAFVWVVVYMWKAC